MAKMGTATLNVDTKIGDTLAVVIAATRLHDALYQRHELVESLPTEVLMAYGDLQRALKPQPNPQTNPQTINVYAEHGDADAIARAVAKASARAR